MIGHIAMLVLGSVYQVTPPLLRHDEPLGGRVTLALTTEQSTYYLGEPVRLRLALQNVSGATIVGAFRLGSPAKTRIYCRRSTADFQQLGHLNVVRGYPLENIVRLDPDAAVTHDTVLAFDPATQRPLLDQLGEYEFFVRYSDTGGPNGLVESNVARVSVVDVPADQREALTAYLQGPAFFADFDPYFPHVVTPEQIQTAADFLERYRGSLYWRDVLDGVWKAVAERVLSDVASESEKALLQKIRDEWADSTPPTLDLLASPSSLWPPNSRMVPVTITVTVTDDQDGVFEVRLVSVTCDDGCDPAQDVAGATLGSDDRDLELRAKRLGTGSGRTYTIVYSATDTGGNTGTAATTVSVPHDQGGTKEK